MQQNYQNGDACCFTGRNPGVDPTAECNVVMAGEVSSDGTCGFASGGGCALATVYFPNQAYRAGYCPSEALLKGTLFPELVLSACCRRRCEHGSGSFSIAQKDR